MIHFGPTAAQTFANVILAIKYISGIFWGRKKEMHAIKLESLYCHWVCKQKRKEAKGRQRDEVQVKTA